MTRFPSLIIVTGSGSDFMRTYHSYFVVQKENSPSVDAIVLCQVKMLWDVHNQPFKTSKKLISRFAILKDASDFESLNFRY